MVIWRCISVLTNAVGSSCLGFIVVVFMMTVEPDAFPGPGIGMRDDEN